MFAPEEGSSRGRLDTAVRFNGQVYLFEFKLISVEFSREARNVAAFEVERG